MAIDESNINTIWSSLLIEELIRCGVDYFCVSPGSRSTPLTVAVARHSGARTLICHDERGAAFHALGYARATGNPAVLICTSGSAVAHYFPAVIEAALDGMPLVILSADRPPELRETGANQTIRQDHLFGSYVKWYFELPYPSAAILARMLLTTVDQAIYRARASPAGPVHLNCPFREPLAPRTESVQQGYLTPLTEWQETSRPYTHYEPYVKSPVLAAVEEIAGSLRGTSRGLIAVGRLHTDTQRQAVVQLLRVLGWPAFVDIASGLRLGSVAAPSVPYFDQLLLSGRLQERYRPDAVLAIGGEPVSKRWLEFIEAANPRHHIVIKDHPFRHDPAHNVSYRWEVDIAQACLGLAEALQPETRGSWGQVLPQHSDYLDQVVSGWLRKERSLNEIAVAHLVSENIPADHGLWLANSMPVRDMDMYASQRGAAVRVGVNRGASGIDGTLAAATGFAAGLQKPVTVILGDLAFIHDINALLQVRESTQPLIIVLINNDGGGIFSFLPIARFSDVFERYFATPHQLDFRPLAELFSLAYAAPKTIEDFLLAYRKALDKSHSTLIEVTTARQDNVRLHQDLQRLILERLERTV